MYIYMVGVWSRLGCWVLVTEMYTEMYNHRVGLETSIPYMGTRHPRKRLHSLKVFHGS